MNIVFALKDVPLLVHIVKCGMFGVTPFCCNFNHLYLCRAVPRFSFWRGRHRLFAAPLSDSSIAVVDAVGSVTVLETGHEVLQRSVYAYCTFASIIYTVC